MLKLDLHVLRRTLPVVVDTEVEHHFLACAGGIAEVGVAALEVIRLPADFYLLLVGGLLNCLVDGCLGHGVSPLLLSASERKAPMVSGRLARGISASRARARRVHRDSPPDAYQRGRCP